MGEHSRVEYKIIADGCLDYDKEQLFKAELLILMSKYGLGDFEIEESFI